MVTIRFARRGAKKHAYYHIVVTDKENARDGRFIEHIGTYDPARPMTEAKIDRIRLQHWVGVGASMSVALKKILREQAKAAVAGTAPALRGGTASGAGTAPALRGGTASGPAG